MACYILSGILVVGEGVWKVIFNLTVDAGRPFTTVGNGNDLELAGRTDWQIDLVVHLPFRRLPEESR
jgi:hypothetical protein